MPRGRDGAGGSRSPGIKFSATGKSGRSDVRNRKDKADARRRFLAGATAFYPMEGTFTPQEALDYLETDPLVCLLCGKGFQMLGRHLSGSHDISGRDYCDMYLIPWSQPSDLADEGHPLRRAEGLATKAHRRALSERQTPEHRAASSVKMLKWAGTTFGHAPVSLGNRAIQRATAVCHEDLICAFCGKTFNHGRSERAECCSGSCATKKRHADSELGHFGSYGKLSEEEVIQIRESEENTHVLGARYGCVPTLISQIQLGQSYRHFGGPIREPAHRNFCLTAAKVLEIRASSEPARALAERYGVGTTTMGQVLTGKTWAHVGGRIRAPAPARTHPVTGRYLPAEPVYKDSVSGSETAPKAT